MEKVTLILDARENTLYNNIIQRDLDKYKDFLEIEKKQLELGDIHIIFKNTTFVIERKSVNDMVSSIKDGRYKEQKHRLLSNIEANKITYIIEGDTIISKHNNHNILSSVYLYSIYRDGIHIAFVKNIEETSTYILTLCTKIIDNSDKFLKNNEEISYIDTCKIKSKKIANIDVKTCYLLQLSQIPTISIVIAKNIENKYPTLRELLKSLDESDNKEKLLCDIDKIGKDKAKKILIYLGYYSIDSF
jgi:crossover junction endonuclease MUS81